MSIAQNTAIFALVGTTYGGDGQTTFGMPDLRGRVSLGTGTGPGLPGYQLGEMSGASSTTLLPGNLPAHTHAFSANANSACSTAAGNADSPAGNIRAGSATDENYAAPAAGNGNMAAIAVSGTTGVAGGSQPLSNMQAYLGMSYIICIEGIFPSRN